MLVQTTMGELPYDAIVAQINARYAEGKTPALAVKSALQLGIDPAIIATFPGVDAAALEEGQALLSSGAFESTATGTAADAQMAAAVGSDQYNARLAAGLDAFGFPPEEVARLTAMGLYGPGRQYDPGIGSPGMLTGASLADQASKVLESSGKANDPRYYDSIVGSFSQGGTIYNVLGDGSIQGIDETPTGAYTVSNFTPEGVFAGQQTSNQFEQTSTDRLLGTLANAALAAGTGFALGPLGAGLLSAPAAAAAGAGVTNFANTGSVQDALKAAALGGAAAYGLGQLFPGTAAVDDFVADNVAELAAQGIGEEQIAQILTQEGFSSSAINTALDAQFGVSAAGSAKGLGDFSEVNPDQVLVTGQNVGLGGLSSLAPALSAVVPSIALPQVQITGQAFTDPVQSLTTPEVVGSVLPSVVGGTTQQVGIESTRLPTQTNNTSGIGAAVGGIVPGIQPAIPTASDKVEVTGQRVNNGGIDTSGISAALPGLAPGLTQPLPKATDPTKKNDKQTTDLINNALKLIGLVAGGGAASRAGSGTGTGTGVGSVPVSNPLNYDDDYYNRIQKYYDQYMPNYPRDVATPLREWYGSGSMGTSGGSTASPGGVGAPGTVVGSLFSDIMRKPSSASVSGSSDPFITELRARRTAAGLPTDPSQWTIQDQVKAAEIQNELQGLGEFGRLVVDPNTGASSRTPIQTYNTLPDAEKQRVTSYLQSVVPIVADRAIASGSGFNDFNMLTNQFRITPEELKQFMTPEQKQAFDTSFGYQIGNDPSNSSRLFGGFLSRSNTVNQPTFSPEITQYLEQAAQLLPNASPEVRKRLEQAIYSGSSMGNLGAVSLLPQEYGAFGVPWWQTPPTLSEGVAALSSGNPEEYYRQQQINAAKGPLSNLFSDASKRGTLGEIGGFEAHKLRDGTPFIEGVNLYGDRPVERLRSQYGLKDEEIVRLLSLIPTEDLIAGTDQRGNIIYHGDLETVLKAPRSNTTSDISGQDAYAMLREGLPKP